MVCLTFGSVESNHNRIPDSAFSISIFGQVLFTNTKKEFVRVFVCLSKGIKVCLVVRLVNKLSKPIIVRCPLDLDKKMFLSKQISFKKNAI